MNNTTPLLSLQNVSVGYPGKDIVRDVSFDVHTGEFCALLGLNGSGKTTLLKGICGLLPLSGGSCHIDGTDISKMSEKKRAGFVSMIPQRHSKLIGITVLDAVLMGLNARLGILETPSAKDKTLAFEALEKMEIPHLYKEDFSRLSEGQKQLVILARTIVQNAPVMLMDEPDSALDFPNKHKTLARIQKLVRDERKACLVTLHDPNLAMNFCDKLILLDNGEIASEVQLKNTGKDDIQKKLTTVYKKITVYEFDGVYKCSM
jgi:iron complex transport system ATP-binding protein